MKIEHVPVPKYPRPKHIGEEVFALRWRELMDAPLEIDHDYDHDLPTRLHVILRSLLRKTGRLTQVQATTAATFVTWLGTNCGQGLLHEMKRYAKSEFFVGGGERAYLAAWSVENSRQAGVNGGIRLLESLLGESFDNPLRPYHLTAVQIEVIDHVVQWLSNGDGAEFVRVCNEEIQALNCERRRVENAIWRRQAKLPYGGDIVRGDWFDWELGNPDAQDRCEVQSVRDGIVYAAFERFGAGRHLSNTIQRFREAATPIEGHLVKPPF